MKKWKIKYQKGNDILITYIEAEEQNVQYIFYMNYPNTDIINIEEVQE